MSQARNIRLDHNVVITLTVHERAPNELIVNCLGADAQENMPLITRTIENALGYEEAIFKRTIDPYDPERIVYSTGKTDAASLLHKVGDALQDATPYAIHRKRRWYEREEDGCDVEAFHLQKHLGRESTPQLHPVRKQRGELYQSLKTYLQQIQKPRLNRNVTARIALDLVGMLEGVHPEFLGLSSVQAKESADSSRSIETARTARLAKEAPAGTKPKPPRLVEGDDLLFEPVRAILENHLVGTNAYKPLHRDMLEMIASGVCREIQESFIPESKKEKAHRADELHAHLDNRNIAPTTAPIDVKRGR